MKALLCSEETAKDLGTLYEYVCVLEKQTQLVTNRCDKT